MGVGRPLATWISSSLFCLGSVSFREGRSPAGFQRSWRVGAQTRQAWVEPCSLDEVEEGKDSSRRQGIMLNTWDLEKRD